MVIIFLPRHLPKMLGKQLINSLINPSFAVRFKKKTCRHKCHRYVLVSDRRN